MPGVSRPRLSQRQRYSRPAARLRHGLSLTISKLFLLFSGSYNISRILKRTRLSLPCHLNCFSCLTAQSYPPTTDLHPDRPAIEVPVHVQHGTVQYIQNDRPGTRYYLLQPYLRRTTAEPPSKLEYIPGQCAAAIDTALHQRSLPLPPQLGLRIHGWDVVQRARLPIGIHPSHDRRDKPLQLATLDAVTR